MKRHTKSEVVFGVFACIVMTLACGFDSFRNAQKQAWGWFWWSLLSTAFWAAVVGWLSIDAFNRMQGRRLAKKK